MRAGLPPILTIHGNGDPIAPYAQAVRFHEALMRAGVRNQLLTISSDTHGDFTDEQTLNAYGVIREFLGALYGVMTKGLNEQGTGQANPRAISDRILFQLTAEEPVNIEISLTHPIAAQNPLERADGHMIVVGFGGGRPNAAAPRGPTGALACLDRACFGVHTGAGQPD